MMASARLAIREPGVSWDEDMYSYDRFKTNTTIPGAWDSGLKPNLRSNAIALL